jgi:hypothetical protein
MRDRQHVGQKHNITTSYCNWSELYYTELEWKPQKSFHMVVLKVKQQDFPANKEIYVSQKSPYSL